MRAASEAPAVPWPDFVTYRKVEERRMVQVTAANISALTVWLQARVAKSDDKTYVVVPGPVPSIKYVRSGVSQMRDFAEVGDLLDSRGNRLDRYQASDWSIEDAST